MGKKLIIKGADFSANAISEEINITSLFTNWVQFKYIGIADGEVHNSSSPSSYASIDYLDISRFTRIKITLPEMSVQAVVGAAFYDSNQSPILPGMGGGISSQAKMTEYTFDVPSNAKYIRATRRDDVGTFACYGYIDE